MTIANLLTVDGQMQGVDTYGGIASTKSNVVFGSLASSLYNASVGYNSYLKTTKRNQTDEALSKLEGKPVADFIKIDETKYTNPTPQGRIKGFEEAIDTFILEKRKTDERYQGIKTYSEINNDIKDEVNFSRQYVGRQAEAEGLLGQVIALAGGMAGSLVTDPVNVATMFVGVGQAKNMLQYAVREAGLNAAIEAVQIPMRKEWEESLGNKYGLGTALADVAFAGVGAAGLGVTARGGAKAFKYVADKSAGVFEKAGSKGLEVLDSVAMSNSVPSAVRDSAKYMSRVAHIDENNPVIRPDIEDVKLHRDNFAEAETAFKENRTPNVLENDRSASWVVVNKKDNKAIFETFNRDLANKVNTDNYKVIPIKDYLVSINGKQKDIKIENNDYALKAIEIKQAVTTKIIDVNKPQELKSILGYAPESLSQFVKRTGGIQDIGGELSARDVGKKSVGLIRKGKTRVGDINGTFEVDNRIDSVKQRVFDEGYFPDKTDYNEISDSELFDAIARDVNGEKIYKSDTLSEIKNNISASDLAKKYDAIGIDETMTEAQIADRLRELAEPIPDLSPPKQVFEQFEAELKMYDDPNYIASVEADYARMMDEDFVFFDADGNKIDMADIDEVMTADDNLVNAIRTCAIG